MSADDVKAAFPDLNLRIGKRTELAKLVDKREWGKATALKEELDGPLPRGRLVRLRPKFST